MPDSGFIHEALDIKILILLILSRLPAAIDLDGLAQLALIDKGFDYFDFTTCLADLEKTGHVNLAAGLYTLTKKGEENSAIAESSLPGIVKRRALDALEPVVKAMRRESLIKTKLHASAGGDTLELSLSDGVGEMLNIRIIAQGESAERFARRFRADPEGVYNRVVEILSE